jgi:hypothetical protein
MEAKRREKNQNNSNLKSQGGDAMPTLLPTPRPVSVFKTPNRKTSGLAASVFVVRGFSFYSNITPEVCI